MVGILRTVYDRKTGEKKSQEIVEILDMTEDEYYAPLVEILGNDIINKMSKTKA